MSYINNIIGSPFFLLFLTAALGALLGKINIKGFTLGSTGGIFTGIFIGWAVIAICYKVPEGSALYSTAQGYIAGLRGSSGVLVPQSFMTFFLLIFIAAIGLSVGKKIKTALNANFVKLIVIGILIPVVSMAITWGCLKISPSLMGSGSHGYQISGLYSGAMTNSAALGTSQEVVYGMTDVQERYQALSESEKKDFLDLIGYNTELNEEVDALWADLEMGDKKAVLGIMGYQGDDVPEALSTNETIATMYDKLYDGQKQAIMRKIGYTREQPAELTEGQIAAFKGAASSKIAMGFGISFPVGTVVIIFLMTIISVMIKRNAKKTGHVIEEASPKQMIPISAKDLVFDAAKFGTVIGIGILLGAIEIPLGNNVTFSLSSVGGVLITALVLGNFKFFNMHFKMLGYLREFSLIFFMSVVGLNNGYKVVSSFSGSGLYLALMALVIEVVAVVVAVAVGRLMRLDWGLLAGGICGGCTSSVGLGAALNTIGGDEPTVGYGLSQPFAILANVILISIFHTYFFI